MKKTKLMLVIILALIMVASLTLVACDPSTDPCPDGKHVDINGDGICDICQAKVEAKCTHADANHDGVCDKCGETGLTVEHTWANGVCSGCGKTCVHEWESGVCKVCALACTHTFGATDGVCTICGTKDPNYDPECYPHVLVNGVCTNCGKGCNHVWVNGVCSACSFQCVHEWANGVCTTCSVACAHDWTDRQGECGICHSTCTAHQFKFGLCLTCGVKDANPSETWTYNMATSQLPTGWNELNYQANTATLVLDYTTGGFFTFDYNSTKDGYVMVPAMAKDFPTNVTAEYASKWGIEPEDDGSYSPYIWKLELRHDLRFDNGDRITTADFIETAKRLLAPEAANYRANSLYSGSMVIVGAENYVKQGSVGYEPIEWDNAGKYNGKLWAELSEEEQKNIFFSLEDSTVAQWAKKNYSSYEVSFVLYALFGAESEDAVKALDEKSAYEILNDPTMKATYETLLASWQIDPGEEFDFFSEKITWPEFSWDNVGLVALDEYNLLFVLKKPLEGFYLHYAMGLPLVHVETYDACAKIEGGVYTNTYGTSVDTFVGYGPYRLTYFVADNSIQFTKNEFWYGYNDEVNKSLYQTTGVSIKKITGDTRLQAFLKGETDSYGLEAKDMEDYQQSKYNYFTEGDSTWFVALNPSTDGLRSAEELANANKPEKTVVKRILAVKEFRQALSFAIDRANYALTLDPMSSTALALYGNMIIADPELGTAYRTTEQAKDTILNFWGLSNWDTLVDEDGERLYATKEEAIASIKGYDPAGAKTLFDKAYDEAVKREFITAEMIASGKWVVQIIIGKPAEHDYYNNGYNYLNQVWSEAIKGTKLEGHVEFKQSQVLGDSFAEFLQRNEVDVLFGVGWTGSTLDPYGLIEAYVSPNYQYDPAWDTTGTDADITHEGKVLRASVYDWYLALSGEKITTVVVGADGKETEETVEITAGPSAEMELRVSILATIENAVLQQYDMIPVGNEASASLKGMRIKFYTEEYVFGVGRGGIKYMTYDETIGSDQAWAEYVKAQGGTLNYKVSN